jgi:hypothetical protein
MFFPFTNLKTFTVTSGVGSITTLTKRSLVCFTRTGSVSSEGSVYVANYFAHDNPLFENELYLYVNDDNGINDEARNINVSVMLEAGTVITRSASSTIGILYIFELPS